MRIEVGLGGRGRYRWIVRDAAGRARAVAPVQGFATEDEAKQDALSVFGSAVTLAGTDSWPEQYAGTRDFA